MINCIQCQRIINVDEEEVRETPNGAMCQECYNATKDGSAKVTNPPDG